MRESASSDVRAVSAAAKLGCVRSDRWHWVGALLIDDGFDGEALVSLASLTSGASGWEVDSLVPQALRELGTPDLTIEEAGTVIAGLLAASLPEGGHGIVRFLAAFAPGMGYPGGVIGQAWRLAEYLDCSCHEGSAERVEAGAFEAELRREPLQARSDLAIALLSD